MSEPIITKRGGENAAFYRTKDSQATLLGRLAKEAIEEAVRERGLNPDRLELKTRYVHGRAEPHTSFGEVKVYDKYA